MGLDGASPNKKAKRYLSPQINEKFDQVIVTKNHPNATKSQLKWMGCNPHKAKIDIANNIPKQAIA